MYATKQIGISSTSCKDIGINSTSNLRDAGLALFSQKTLNKETKECGCIATKPYLDAYTEWSLDRFQKAPEREVNVAIADENPMTVIVAGFGHVSHAFEYAKQQKANIVVVYPNSVNINSDSSEFKRSEEFIKTVCEPYLHTTNNEVTKMISSIIDPLYKKQLDALAAGKNQ